MIDTDSVITSSYPRNTIIVITLAVMMPMQITAKNAIMTLHEISSSMMKENARDMPMPRSANSFNSFSVAYYAKNELAN